MSGPMRSGYSANENAGEATQISGTKNPSHARVRRMISCLPLRSFTTLTPRLRRPCGARMTTITMVATRITAFAIHGFMALTKAAEGRTLPYGELDHLAVEDTKLFEPRSSGAKVVVTQAPCR